MWTEGQVKTTRRRRLEDKNNKKISNIEIDDGWGDIMLSRY
jgi:hypothetical protein